MAGSGANQGAERLRLAFVCHCLRPEDGGAGRIGGAERAAAELLAALRARSDVEVRLLTASAASDRLRFAGFAVRTLMELERRARAGEIDAVLFTAFPTAWMSLVLAPMLRRRGIATAAICHGHDITFALPAYQWLLPKVFAALDAVLPVSRATGAECLARGIDPARLQVVFNGADLDRFASPPPFEARRGVLRCAFPDETRDLADEELVLCAVGRQVERKGHAWFVRAVMPKVAGRTARPRRRLLRDRRADTAAAAMACGVASSCRRSISRDFEMSQFWQNLQARLQPAVPNERMLEPG